MKPPLKASLIIIIILGCRSVLWPCCEALLSYWRSRGLWSWWFLWILAKVWKQNIKSNFICSYFNEDMSKFFFIFIFQCFEELWKFWKSECNSSLQTQQGSGTNNITGKITTAPRHPRHVQRCLHKQDMESWGLQGRIHGKRTLYREGGLHNFSSKEANGSGL